MSVARVIARAQRDLLGEAPLWSARENALFWVDILGRKLNKLSLADAAVSTWDIPELICWVIERQSRPGFIAGLQSGFVELTLEPFAIVHIVNPEPELPGNRLNDAKADSLGRIWAGSMAIDGNRSSGALYRLDPDRYVTTVDRGYTIANGPALSPEERFLYHTDSKRNAIYRFRVEADGTLSGRRVFIAFESDWGSPDGMTVDADGGLWVAHWGGARVSRFHDDGRWDRSIMLPASRITSCTFAGAALDRMFVTSARDGSEHESLAGALFEIDPDRRGLAPCRYGG